jgi:hypothetical protein
MEEESHGTPDRGDEPQQHVGQIDPDCILHSSLTALTWAGLRSNVDVAEEAEESCPKDATLIVSKTSDLRWSLMVTHKRIQSQGKNFALRTKNRPA